MYKRRHGSTERIYKYASITFVLQSHVYHATPYIHSRNSCYCRISLSSEGYGTINPYEHLRWGSTHPYVTTMRGSSVHARWTGISGFSLEMWYNLCPHLLCLQTGGNISGQRACCSVRTSKHLPTGVLLEKQEIYPLIFE